MKLTKLILSTIILLSSTYLSAQDATDISSYAPRDYTIIPPSPEVASMVRNVDYPVSPFTGQVDISLPIYTISEGNLSVPISVQYLSGGLKVDDQPGNLGLSWILNAGGCVSRTVYGHPDDAGSSTIVNNIRGIFNKTIKTDSLREYAKSTIGYYDPSDPNAFIEYRLGRKDWDTDYYFGRADVANDILKISCMGLSGTFIYNDNKDVVISSSEPISISPNEIVGSLYPNQFIITDNKGTKYYFGHVKFDNTDPSIERTKYEYYHGNPGDQMLDSMYYTSAWHLTKIKNLQNDSIIFHYKTKNKRTKTGALVQTYYASSNPDLRHLLPSPVSSCGEVIYNPVSLCAIESSSAIVRFTYDNDSKNEKITKIEVYPNYDTNTPIKTFNFNYTPFNNTNGQKRTLLTKIAENGINQYQFAYYTEPNTNEIPFRELDQDFCGYYNAAGNAGIAPSYHQFSHHTPCDRSVNPNVCYYGALKSIIYPTGGSTEFEWESHEYGYFDNIQVEEPDKTTTTHLHTDTLIALEPIKKLVIDNYHVSSNQYVTVDLSEYFNFNPQILLNSDYYGLCHEYDDCINVKYPRVTFIKESTNQSCAEHTIFIDDCTISGQYKGKVDVHLEPNVSYRVELQYPTSIFAHEGIDNQSLIEREFMHADAPCGKIFLNKYTTTSNSNSSLKTHKDIWGGLRISRIISKADEDGEPIVKGYYYAYTKYDESSGVISNVLDYAGKYYYITKNSYPIGNESSEFYQISSNGFYNLPVGNVGVEYFKVNEWCSHQIELENDTYSNSNTVQYNYSSNQTEAYRDFNNSEFLDYQSTGSQMWTSKAHYRGNLMSKQLSNRPGYDEKINIKYNYNIFEPEPENLSVFTTDLFRIADFSSASISNAKVGDYDYCIGKYNLIPYNKTIKNEIYIEDKYCDTTQYTYFYDSYTDNLDYNLLRSKIKTTSDGKNKETFYTYRYVNGVYLNIPETEVTVVDGIIVDAKRMVYDNNNLLIKSYGLSEKGINASGYDLGGKSASLQLVNLINQPEYSYEYNNHGDLVQISYNNEVLASYLWGYRGSYPIVEVKNLPYSELLSTINSLGKSPEQFYSATGNVESDLSSFFNSLRNALPNNDITTMTYHWLIGVSSATDSRGITTHFSFDNQGRLSTVKDYNGYFIRKYDYHYKQ